MLAKYASDAAAWMWRLHTLEVQSPQRRLRPDRRLSVLATVSAGVFSSWLWCCFTLRALVMERVFAGAVLHEQETHGHSSTPGFVWVHLQTHTKGLAESAAPSSAVRMYDGFTCRVYQGTSIYRNNTAIDTGIVDTCLCFCCGLGLPSVSGAGWLLSAVSLW